MVLLHPPQYTLNLEVLLEAPLTSCSRFLIANFLQHRSWISRYRINSSRNRKWISGARADLASKWKWRVGPADCSSKVGTSPTTFCAL